MLDNSNNRPISAASKANSLGSHCPIILKYDFPNESKYYLDDVVQQESNT